MKDENIIAIKESNRPIWQIPVAAISFTIAFGLILTFILFVFFKMEYFRIYANNISFSIYLIIVGIFFSSRKHIYIDIKNSKFRATKEVGPIKIGRWITINNYEYVSIFTDLMQDGSLGFCVNLWCDNNQHFTLYTENDFELVVEMAYDLSEKLNIDLLDATIPNKQKWIDKEELKQKFK
ncbi:hypothetical protein [uncultured Lacinutrix sp.]|uniref:hypothetical protein n=1 Tax=uncultured Lacinutrix sp. TaxID=574032 RepID=UPI002608636E|nr:hypothetical protein [uncultured Lacinutrix sp.]